MCADVWPSEGELGGRGKSWHDWVRARGESRSVTAMWDGTQALRVALWQDPESSGDEARSSSLCGEAGQLAMIKTVAGRGRGMDERRERGEGCEGGGGYIGSG